MVHSLWLKLWMNITSLDVDGRINSSNGLIALSGFWLLMPSPVVEVTPGWVGNKSSWLTGGAGPAPAL